MEEKKNKDESGLGTENRVKDRIFTLLREEIAKGTQFSDEEVEVFFGGIRAEIARGRRFTFNQMDTGVELFLPALPKSDRDIFRESAHHNHVPLWQANLAHFRRSHEQGMAFNLFLDPGWRSGDLYGLSPEVCEECGKTFTPERFKSKLCSNKCGAEVERRRLGLPTIEEQLKTLETEKSQEQRVQEEDRAMLGQKKEGPIASPVV